jgi:hypothetical protein
MLPPNPALDTMMREDLNAWSSLWFWILVGSTIIVAIGIICEAPEVWQAVGFGHKAIARIRYLWYIRVRKVDLNGWARLCPELITHRIHHGRTVAVMGFIGWTLVALGVAGEGAAEYFVNDAETDIRAFDEGMLIEAQQRAGDAATSAKTAHEEADSAAKAAGKAQEKIRDVEGRANNLSKALAEAESKLETEKRNRVKLALRMLPTRVFWNQSGAINALSEFPKMEVIFEYGQEGDEESLAEQINFVASRVRWVTWHRPPTLSFPASDAFGVKIFTGGKSFPKPPLRLPASESVAGILQSYLRKGGVETQIGDQFFEPERELPPDTILISVGPKPMISLEDAMTELGEPITPANNVYGAQSPIPDKPPKRPITIPK